MMFLLGIDNGRHVLLDAQVNHFIAVIGENDINKIFTNIMNVPLDGGDQHFTAGLVLPFGFLHVRFQIGHSSLHGLGGLQHKGQLHLPGTKEFTHHLHPIQEKAIDNLQGWTCL